MCACARKSCSRSWSIADVSTVVGVRTRFSAGGTVVSRTLVVVVLVLSPDSVAISRSGLADVCDALDTSFDPSMSLDVVGGGKKKIRVVSLLGTTRALCYSCSLVGDYPCNLVISVLEIRGKMFVSNFV